MLVILKWKMCGSYVINALAILPFCTAQFILLSPTHTHTLSLLQQRVAHYPPLPEKTFHSPSTSWDTNVHV